MHYVILEAFKDLSSVSYQLPLAQLLATKPSPQFTMEGFWLFSSINDTNLGGYSRNHQRPGQICRGVTFQLSMKNHQVVNYYKSTQHNELV